MKLTTIGVIGVAVALLAVALGVFPFDDRVTEVPLPPPEKTASAASSVPAAPPDAVSSSPEMPAGSGPERRDDEDLEQVFFTKHSLDTARLPDLWNDDVFRELLAQLREEDSAISADKRRSYQLYFYSRPLVRSAAVTLDVLECGSHLCVAEFRASKQDVLRRFSEDLMAADDFEPRATMALVGEADPSGVVTRRVVFAHDPTISAVTLPPGTVLSDITNNAGKASEIH